MRYDFSILTKRLAKINFASTNYNLIDFYHYLSHANKELLDKWYSLAKKDWLKTHDLDSWKPGSYKTLRYWLKTDKQSFDKAYKGYSKLSFSSIDDYLTENGKATQEKYKTLLKKYNLTGFMEMSGCISIENGNFSVLIGGKELEDVSGWTIQDNDSGDILYDSRDWDKMSDKEILTSIDLLYSRCKELFGEDFATKVKKLALELNTNNTNFALNPYGNIEKLQKQAKMQSRLKLGDIVRFIEDKDKTLYEICGIGGGYSNEPTQYTLYRLDSNGKTLHTIDAIVKTTVNKLELAPKKYQRK